jgi:opacity protein-like surface antigen
VWRATFAISGGVDFYLTRDFFLTAELKGRAFSDLSDTDPHNYYGSGVSMSTVLVGAGVYF